MFHLLCPHNKIQRKTSLSNPSLQELAIQLESIGITAITRPSLQDFLYQELNNNSLFLNKILDLSSPSLQAFKIGASYHALSAKADYFPRILDVGPYISSSNHGFVPPSTLDSPADPFDIRDHLSSFGAARGFF